MAISVYRDGLFTAFFWIYKLDFLKTKLILNFGLFQSWNREILKFRSRGQYSSDNPTNIPKNACNNACSFFRRNVRVSDFAEARSEISLAIGVINIDIIWGTTHCLHNSHRLDTSECWTGNGVSMRTDTRREPLRYVVCHAGVNESRSEG